MVWCDHQIISCLTSYYYPPPPQHYIANAKEPCWHYSSHHIPTQLHYNELLDVCVSSNNSGYLRYRVNSAAPSPPTNKPVNMHKFAGSDNPKLKKATLQITLDSMYDGNSIAITYKMIKKDFPFVPYRNPKFLRYMRSTVSHALI